MFKLLKSGYCFAPENMGRKDILVVYNKIYKIADSIPKNELWESNIIDCTDQIVCPGFVDQHVHITGGGGEEGLGSRIPELMLGDILAAGVTTVVGMLGVDGITRNIAGLLAKAHALQSEGINTYICTGGYSVSAETLTGRVMSDIALIDKIIGVGEIAISDHRSSHASVRELMKLASEARVGGLLGKKAGIMHIHVGDGSQGLEPLFKLVDKSDFPINMFVPTHINRNKTLFQQGIDFLAKGGNIDLTSGGTSTRGYGITEALEILLNSKSDMERVTISSDANGSIPANEGGNTGVGKIIRLFEDIKECIVSKRMDMETVLKTVTSNAAKILKLYPLKGALLNGSDADILILNKDDLSIDKMLIGGELFINNGSILRRGRYENG